MFSTLCWIALFYLVPWIFSGGAGIVPNKREPSTALEDISVSPGTSSDLVRFPTFSPAGTRSCIWEMVASGHVRGASSPARVPVEVLNGLPLGMFSRFADLALSVPSTLCWVAFSLPFRGSPSAAA